MRIFKTVAALGVIVAAGLASVASAKTDQYYYSVVFYSDATYTTVVGEYRQWCLGNTTIYTPLVTGQTSPYSTKEILGTCPGLGDW